MSPKQANSNSVEGSASQHNQQQDAINLSISTVPGEFAEAQQTQQNQQGDLIDLNAPEIQTVQEGSQHPQWKVDDLLCTDNQSFQQRQQQNEFFKLLKKSVKGFTDWPAKKQALAVAAVSAAFPTVLLVVTAALPLATAGLACATVGLALFFTVKAVSYAYKGLKWSGEKAVKGLRHVAEKTVEGAKKGYEHSRDSLKRGTSFIEEKTKEKASSMLVTAANKLYNAAGTENYGDKLDALTEEQRKLSHDVRKDLKKIFDDKGNNTGVINNILSEIKSKIDSKITSIEAESFTASVDDYVNNITLITRWKEQKKFINNLDEDSLHHLLTQRTVPKTKYMLNSTFSEHHDEIKKVITECKEDHYLRSQEKQERKAKRSSSASSLPESGSSNSLNSESTVGSSAELLNSTEHKEVEPTTSWKRAKGKISTFFKGNNAEAEKETSSTEYQDLSKSSPVKTATVRRANSNPSKAGASIPVPMPVVPNVAVPPKPSRAFMTHSDSLGSLNSNASSLSANSRSSGSESTSSLSYHRNSDSGVSSADSSPRHSGPQVEVKPDELKNLRLKRTGSLNNGEFKPSTQITVHAEVHQHDTTTKLV